MKHGGRHILSLNPDYEKRVFGLDLMRSIAIINVVLVHAGWAYEKIGNIPIKLISGVELFFVLSGFLIGSMLLRMFLAEKPYNLRAISRFWVRRWFRTLPNYYLILLLNIIVVYFGIIQEDFAQFNWRFFLFLQNFDSYFQGFFWESWSLSIEEWFYFLFPMILGLAYLAGRRARISKRYVFLCTIILFEAVSLVLRLAVAGRFEVDDYWYDVKIHKVVVYHFDGIALGLLGAYLKHYHPVGWHRCRNITFVLGIVISYAVLYAGWDANSYVNKGFKILLQGVGCALLLPRFETWKEAPMWLRRPVTHISLISYSMYLINLSLVSSVIVAHVDVSSVGEGWLWYAIYWAVVIVASTLIYKYYEKPIMDLRERFKRN